MFRIRTQGFIIVSWILLFYGGFGFTEIEPSAPGMIIVEEVGKNSTVHKAGLKPGDTLKSWELLGKISGNLKTPWDFLEMQTLHAPRGPIELKGQRGTESISFEVQPGIWDISIRPDMSPEIFQKYNEAASLLAAGNVIGGCALLRQLASEMRKYDPHLSGWFDFRAAEKLVKDQKWGEAINSLDEALAVTPAKDLPFANAWMLLKKAEILEHQSDFAKAEATLKLARSNLEPGSSDTLAIAHVLSRLGKLAYKQSDLNKSQEYETDALAIREKLAQGSLDVAASLNNLGNVFVHQGEISKSDTQHEKALNIRERLAPNSTLVAASLGNLGINAYFRGDYAVAEEYYLKSSEIFEREEPDGLALGRNLTNLGAIAHERGDLAQAESYYKQSLKIWEKMPESLELAALYNNLGNVIGDRGDYALAKTYYLKTLTIEQNVSPDSLDVAYTFGNLGAAAFGQKDFVSAEKYFLRSLEITEKMAPGSLYHADVFINLSSVAIEQNDLTVAEEYLKKALAIKEAQAPNSLPAAFALHNLGQLFHKRSEFEKAEYYYRKALAIRERLAPLSLWQASALHDLAKLFWKKGDLVEAAKYFNASIEVLEAQKGKLGGTEETKAIFSARYSDLYRNYIEVLLELNETEQAFNILERSRARSLLAMIAERNMIFTQDLPDDLEKERKRTNIEYDETQAAISELNPVTQKDEIEKLLTQLGELREKQSDMEAMIRKASPQLASLLYPSPLDFQSAQKELDPGTLLLSYSIGIETSHVFVLKNRGNLSVHRISVGRSGLIKAVEDFRKLVTTVRLTPDQLQELVSQGKSLYQLLLSPVRAAIDESERILVIPDGPLHFLPFSAVVVSNEPNSQNLGRNWQYLAELKPIVTIVSATVFSEVKKSRNKNMAAYGKLFTGFGDPAYGDASGKAGRISSPSSERGVDLISLPSTRTEINSIAGLFGSNSEAYVGADATEEKVKSIRDTRYLHFACHGLLDDRFPLNSSLALTIPEKREQGIDNGFLQAWEIFERVRINSDLVVLSACETAVGKEVAGEGLIGLTRAFQYAGARTVLASLWNIADETTAELMTLFYKYLTSGITKDAALQKAQRHFITSTIQIDVDGQKRSFDASAPFFWAAFQLTGDWR
jgi:CHAT domain-containing protein/Tfp pilus assembly protein PilF